MFTIASRADLFAASARRTRQMSTFFKKTLTPDGPWWRSIIAGKMTRRLRERVG